MQLKDFVSESLVEIIEGLEDAQTRIQSSDAKVVPEINKLFVNSNTGGTNLAFGYDKNGNVMHHIEFDVAVTASEGKETKGGIGVVAGMFALGSQGASQEANQSISRIKFKVPVSFPRHKN